MRAAPLALAIADLDGSIMAANDAWAAVATPLLSAEALSAGFRAAAASNRPASVSVGATGPGRLAVTVTRAADGWFWLTANVSEGAVRGPRVSPPLSPEDSPGSPPSGRHVRLAAVGQLAGGVAHDFNNLLTAIGLRADELLQRRPIGDPDYDNLAQIRATVARAASLAGQLLAFASRATRRREIVDLGELLGDLEVLLRRLLREDMRLDVELARDLPSVLADPGQLETVFVNLVINARDAIAAAGLRGGRVAIHARRVDVEEARRLGHVEAAGDAALVEIADNGPGIAPALIDTIFDPFFTTKPRGEGTGLGLATVYGVVRQSDGWVGVASAPGEGARFTVLLPERLGPARLRPAHGPPALPARPRDMSGGGRILLVEDEDLVRGIAARLLRGRGYEVLEAADGEAALALARDNAGAIALLISDVVMPGLDGPALLAAARPHLGDIPVLFVSGYAESEFSDLLEAEPTVGFIAKPLDFKTLAERVKQALSSATAR